MLDRASLGDSGERSFHELRKQLGGAAVLTAELPGIVRESDRNAVMVRDLTAFVTEMGLIADRMADRDLAPKKQRPKIEREIDRAWGDLRKEMKKDLEGALGDFRNNLVM